MRNNAIKTKRWISDPPRQRHWRCGWVWIENAKHLSGYVVWLNIDNDASAKRSQLQTEPRVSQIDEPVLFKFFPAFVAHRHPVRIWSGSRMRHGFVMNHLRHVAVESSDYRQILWLGTLKHCGHGPEKVPTFSVQPWHVDEHRLQRSSAIARGVPMYHLTRRWHAAGTRRQSLHLSGRWKTEADGLLSRSLEQLQV